MRKKKYNKPTKFSNLYKFIRLMLGKDIRDRQIARRWDMDVKNFYDFKVGKYPVPKVERLLTLARVLQLNAHLVFEVASGTPAQRIYHLIKKNHLIGKEKVTERQLDQIHRGLLESERRYQKIFHHANDAIFVADARTGELIDCNKKAEQLLGRSREEIIGLNRIYLHPPKERLHYQQQFRRHVKQGYGFDAVHSEVIRKDGKIIPVHISSNVFEIDGRKVIQGIFRDVSKLKTHRKAAACAVASKG